MRTVAAGVVLLLAAVSGCSAEDAAPAEVGPLASATPPISPSEQSEEPSGDPGESASSPPGTAAPEYGLPEAAKLETAAGAVAFAKHYLHLISDGFARADSSAVRAASADGCEGCDAIMSVIDSLAPQGRRRVGGQYVVRDAVAPEVVNGDVIVLISYERTPSQVVDANGVAVETAPATPRTEAQMRLVFRGEEGWRVQGYRVV